MKKVLVVLLCLGLVGCVGAGYYTRPDSEGYYKQVFNASCQNCSRIFTYSTYQYDTIENITCPFCGLTQNLKMARARLVYDNNIRRQEVNKERARQREEEKRFKRQIRAIESTRPSPQPFNQGKPVRVIIEPR